MRHLARRTAWLVVTWVACAAATASAGPAETRAAFLKMIDRPRVDLAAKEKRSEADGLVQVAFSFASEAGERVPGILVTKSGEGRRPAVIVLHGTGEKKESHLADAKQLAARGFAGVVMDGRYHGERGNSNDYNAAIARTFIEGGGHPFYYDTVWDVMRLVDYLSTRDDVDPKRIGLIGFSKGGIETYFTSAVDERITVAVPCIGVQSFNWALEHDAWHVRVGTVKAGFMASANSIGITKPDADFVRKFYDRVVPGIYTDYDCPVMLTLIAPRPLMVISGDRDPNCPLEGAKLAAASAKQAYDAASASDGFKHVIERDTGHKVNADAFKGAVDWFERWLKPSPGAAQ